MKGPSGKITPISVIVHSVFSRIESEKNLSKEAIEFLWRTVCGEAAFKHSRPVALKKGIFAVSVDSSGWMQELSLRKRGLLKALKRELGKDRIAEIHFKIGEF